MARATDSAGWTPLAKLISLWGITRQAFHENIRPLAPESAVRGAGKRGVEIHFPTLLAAYVAHKVDLAAPDSDDPLLSAGKNSPNLERYRLAKAIEAEKNNAERDNVLVRRTTLLESLRPSVAGMRAAGERLIRQFGNDAGLIFNEAVNDFESAVIRAIPPERASDDDKKTDRRTDLRGGPGVADAGTAPANAE